MWPPPPHLCARLDAALAVGDEAEAQQADAEKGEREAGSGALTDDALTVPLNDAVNAPIVAPSITRPLSVGTPSRPENAKLKEFGARRTDGDSRLLVSIRDSGGLLTLRVSPGPPSAPKAASANMPWRKLPVQPAPLLMQKVPS